MDSEQPLTLKIIKYITPKLSGAGFLFLFMFLYAFLHSGFNLYSVLDELSSSMLWLLIFGYGILCSLLIDLIVHQIPRTNIVFRMSIGSFKSVLYVISGFAIFQVFGMNAITIIAGFVGGVCALIFYMASSLAYHVRSFRVLFGILVPIILIALLNIDFTAKSGWTEERTDSSYSASFDSFNGRHEIPIELEEGEVFTVTHEFNNTNGAGHGFHIRNEKNQYVGMEHISDEPSLLQLNVGKAGIYKIVITGERISGSFTVNWTIE
ncbi:hypothetical protein RYX45_06150 [Alkalihalophilus pseudofirmus]|uniref:Uncharacterized protein n=1 Tax=Alkalihalophilus pseudofirmus TaxID=79885 RepID=A0AAJ2NKW8_ALKPS|nr:hypothetical protein [Alkalihalophilus pseudofirmus]MDV2884751.1 hypothetical protein [Alkalihalophilus pseudofirmus]